MKTLDELFTESDAIQAQMDTYLPALLEEEKTPEQWQQVNEWEALYHQRCGVMDQIIAIVKQKTSR